MTVGVDVEDSLLPALSIPEQLSLPALKLLRLEKLVRMTDCHLDCPSLEALHIREVEDFTMPTGLGSCSRLTTLDVAAPRDTVHDAYESAGLLPAIESVQSTLEVLDISGWGFASNVLLELISRLPRLHTLVAQRSGLKVVPPLPATLKSLDLRANGFTEVPVQLESLTQLTSLALSSEESSVNFQIRRPLDAIISLPHLRELTLALDTSAYGPGFTVWGPQSLYYLGLAQHEIDRTNSTLLLKL
ncbi:hypothetical protein COCOBI_06-0180 [Coccomyxa sp. Obi]|nr:hypothetical protein COCOBI_06-0180 [Coccomyxa sp. Obi]